MILKGTIATLRPLTVDDAEVTFKWRQGARAKFLQRGAQTVEQQRGWIASKVATSELNFIIEYRERSVGMIALLDVSSVHRSAQMGRLLVGEEDWVGKAPVAFEAEMVLCDHAFDVMNLHKLYGDVMEDNHGMLKMRRYLGYHQDGILRHHYIYDGEYKDTVAVSILEDEYRRVCRPKLQQLIAMMSVG